MVFAALRASARGYVPKGTDEDELVRAIRSVAAGEAIFNPTIANHVSNIFSKFQVADRSEAIIRARDAGIA